MAKSTLNIIACIAAIFLLEVQGQRIRGDYAFCSIDSQCESNICNTGFCEPKFYFKCDYTHCKENELCEYAKCPIGTFCTPPLPKCVPKSVLSFKTGVGLTKPVNPCANLRCQPGYKCRTTIHRCNKPPCRAPYTACMPTNPCSYTTCLKGYKCILSKINPTYAQCVRKDPCEMIKCKSGYKCKIQYYSCSSESCKPPRATCVQINPCKFTTCLRGYKCVVNTKSTKIAQCMRRDPCEMLRCKTGFICETTTYTCNKLPCKLPLANCVPNKSFLNETYLEGYDCIFNENDTTVKQCIRKDACTTVRCKAGYICKSITCLKPPCKPPHAKCIHINRCLFKTCLEGYYCIPNKNNPYYTECVPIDPCAAVKCKSGYKCNVISKSCQVVAKPCPQLSTECVLIDPCTYTSCLEGYNCITKKEDPTVAQCVHKDPCETVHCKDGYVCNVVTLNYTKELDPLPSTECVPIDPCASTICSEGHDCLPTDDDPTISQCLQINPCSRTTCLKGYDCYSKEVDPTVAECIPKDPCENVICRRGYVCIPLKLNYINSPETPPSTQCVEYNPCSFTRCLEGYDCFRSMEDPEVGQCVPKDLCANVKCEYRYMCIVITLNSTEGPNPTQVTECVPIKPCNLTTCEKGFRCITSLTNPRVADCASTGIECRIKCDPGHRCVYIGTPCITRHLCGNSLHVCVPNDPCENKTCLKGYDCYTSEENPVVSQCLPKDPCATVKCKPGYTCNIVTLNCRKTPCPPLFTECVPIDKCESVSCPEGYDCVPSDVNPTVVECIPNPCENVRCKSGYKCNVITPFCAEEPCLPSYGECSIPINPCLYTSCLGGHVCSQKKDDPSVAECVQNPCVENECTFGSICQAITENCLNPPCSPPIGRCALIKGKDPCWLFHCDKSDYRCKNVRQKCDEEPCPQFKGVCEAYVENPCDSNLCPKGSYCTFDGINTAVCNTINPCDQFICQDYHKCKITKDVCSTPPCPIGPKCVLEN